jgi:excisionase family DNA binding protein
MTTTLGADPLPRLYTADEIAERFGVAVSTLAYWRWLGRGPRFTKLGSRVRYAEDDVREWLESRARTATA